MEKYLHRFILIVLFCTLMAGCAHYDIESLGGTASPLYKKLRVFVLPLETGSNWRTPYSIYAELILKKTAFVWQMTGIYEVISKEEYGPVIGPNPEGKDWLSNNSDLARQAAKKINAEYVMLAERKMINYDFFWDTTLINAATGRTYKVSMRVIGGTESDFQRVIKASYEQVFHDAREDMLATAMRITQNITPSNKVEPAASIKRDLDFNQVKKEQKVKRGSTPIAVYDISTTNKNPVVALILTEALRQELLKLDNFKLISRESSANLSKELSIQLTGVVDEQQAVKVGKWLAAKQVVMGQYENIGSSSVLQVKRIDVETQQTLGAGMLRCNIGQEDDLLKRMPDLAVELAIDK